MTDLTDKLADVIGKNVSQSPRGIAHAIIAALPGMVKPLEWEDGKIGDNSERMTADSVVGRYEVILWSNGSYGGTYPTTINDNLGVEFSGLASMAEAVNAANAHKAAAIMSELGVEGE